MIGMRNICLSYRSKVKKKTTGEHSRLIKIKHSVLATWATRYLLPLRFLLLALAMFWLSFHFWYFLSIHLLFKQPWIFRSFSTFDFNPFFPPSVRWKNASLLSFSTYIQLNFLIFKKMYLARQKFLQMTKNEEENGSTKIVNISYNPCLYKNPYIC